MTFRNVVHLNLIGQGGAWNAASRISESIESQGYISKLESLYNQFNTPKGHSRVFLKLDHELGRLVKAPTSISFSRGQVTKNWFLGLERKYSNVDIWNLHWIPGHINQDFLKFLSNKNIVWTFHDMNPFTGVCHYSGECTHYEQSCSNCPQLPKLLQPLGPMLLMNKAKSLEQIPNLRFVSPSLWLCSAFQESSIGKNLSISHIPNPIPSNKIQTDKMASIPTITILGSNYIHSKNSLISANAILSLKKNYPNSKFNLQVIGTPYSELSQLNQECLPIGSSGRDTNEFLEKSDIFLYTSILDNLPSFVLEAQAAGNGIVAFDRGGIKECFLPNISGYIVAEDEVEIAVTLQKLLTDMVLLGRMAKSGREFINQNFSSEIVADKYLALYNDMLINSK